MNSVCLLILFLFVVAVYCAQECTQNNDCPFEECCQKLKTVHTKFRRYVTVGTCQPYTKEGQVCNPYARSHGYCGCEPDTLCHRTVIESTTPNTPTRATESYTSGHVIIPNPDTDNNQRGCDSTPNFDTDNNQRGHNSIPNNQRGHDPTSTNSYNGHDPTSTNSYNGEYRRTTGIGNIPNKHDTLTYREEENDKTTASHYTCVRF